MLTETTTRTEDLTRQGDCKICHQHFCAGGHYDRKRLASVGICPSCDSWMGLVQKRNDPSHLRINGVHYIIDNSGTGKDYFTVQKGGKTIGVKQLWHQGVIPKAFRNILSDNARFAKRIEVTYYA